MFAKLCAKRNKKGFTLAELLIVIAILGVLVAIAFPIFTTSLEKANAAVADANFRSAKAVAATAKLDKESDATAPSGYFFDETTGTFVASGGFEAGDVSSYSVTGATKGAKIKSDGNGDVSWTS